MTMKYKIVILVFICFFITVFQYANQDRSALLPSQVLIGEWRAATKDFKSDPEYPRSRMYFNPVNPKTGIGIRTLKMEDGKKDSGQYSIIRDEKENRILEILIHRSEGNNRKAIFKFDKSGKRAEQRFYVTDKFFIDTHHIYVGPIPTKQTKSVKDFISSGKLMMVRVLVWDETSRNSIHDRAELWFRGLGSWYFKKEIKYGGAPKNLGKRTSGEKSSFSLYPDSRDGKEFVISFMMTDDMNPEGSTRDSIRIEIHDGIVKVSGLPIKAVTGKVEIEFKR